MDGRQADYSQSGLSSPYPQFADHHSEAATSDPASAAQYSQNQDPRAANFSSSATPTSEYGLNPSSARSGSFQDYARNPQYSGQAANAGPMAQTSPSMPLADGQNNHHNSHRNSDNDVPIDPSIAAATSPTYAQHQQYSPYTPQHDMGHYAGHPGTPSPMYGGRPEWAGQYPPGAHQLSPYGQHPASSAPPTPAMVSPRPPAGGHPLSTVYSFVPIPGAQQHKRPRRRYEEIERMYKCGWNGCEKAYGTLNHLNAHVTMQSHGAKRTPEEFKEIRKEWKAKKKEEEAARKADDERQRADGRPEGGSDGQPVYGGLRSQIPPGQMGGPQLPPIGYAPATGGQAPPYGSQGPGMPDGMPQYAPNHPPYSNGGAAHNNSSNYPPSPYGQNQMYQQPSDNGPNNYQQ